MSNLRNYIIAVFVALSFGLVSPLASAQTAPIYTGYFSNTAAQGHDVVAYFNDGKPVKGDEAFATTHQGAEFHFTNAENLAKFEANPEAFAPQYGGYCAWAVSQGYTAKGNAKNWKIVDGKLYLNYNSSIQKKWEGDIPGFVSSADTNWPTILAE